MDSMLFEETVSLMLDGNALAGLLHELFDDRDDHCPG